MPKRLSNLRIKEVSLVKKGANKRRFLILKSADNENTNGGFLMDQILKELLEHKFSEPSKVESLVKSIDNETLSVATTAFLAAVDSAEGVPDGFGEEVFKAAGIDIPKEIVEKKVVVEKGEEEKPEIPENLSDEAKALFKAHQDEMEKLRKALDDERKVRKSEQDAIVRKGIEDTVLVLKSLPGEKDKLTDALHNVMKGEAKADDYSIIKDVLEKSNTLIEKSAAMKEIGSGAVGGGDAWEKINKMAEEMVQKSSDDTLTHEAAVAKVMERHPELYDEYIATKH